jgi:hypothetical protein
MKKKISENKKKCLRCDGTGQVCDVCGESEAACTCNEEENGEVVNTTFGECPDCKGAGE